VFQTRLFVAAVLALSIVGCEEETEAPATPYYQGKTITFLVGFAPGGGYDKYANLTAKYMVKYIPGAPEWRIENLETNGSMDAANRLYNETTPDGLTIGSFNTALTIQDAIGNPDVAFDSDGFGWIGAPAVGNIACAVMGAANLPDWAAVAASGTSLQLGATARGSTTYDVPQLINATVPTLSTDMTVNTGYGGTSQILAALRSGEVQGVCFSWDSMRSTGRAMLDASGAEELIPFLADGNIDPEDTEVNSLPTIQELATDAADLEAVRAWLGQLDIERALSVSPGTPSEYLEILRSAYAQALRDPELLAEAADPDGDPSTNDAIAIHLTEGAAVQARVAEIAGISDTARNLLGTILQ
jgi:tripartite-type tricarboxylate transporter receptor subunit TctC